MKNAPAATMTVKVPIAFKRQRGRKRIVAPDGTELAPLPAPPTDNTLVKAIARAHRWQRMLESGEYGTLSDLAKAERISPSYVSRVLRLTFLAPSLIDQALDGSVVPVLDLTSPSNPFPVDWNEQERLLDPSARLGQSGLHR